MAYFGAQGRMGHKYVDTSEPLYGLGGDIGLENTSGWGKVWPDGRPSRGTGEYELRGLGEYELRGLGGFGEYELRGLGTDTNLQPSVMSPENINTLMPEFWMPAEVDHISFTYPAKEIRNEGRTFWTLGVPPPSFGYDPSDVARGFGCSKRVRPEAQGGVPLGKCLDLWAGSGNFVAAVYGSGECADGGWQITKVPVAQAALLRKDAYGAASGFKPYLLAMPGLAYPTQQSWAPYILAVTGLQKGGGALPGSDGKAGGVVAAGMGGGSKLVPILVLAGIAYWIWGLPPVHCANMTPCPDAAQTHSMT